jgi:hypothetical protein
MRGIIRSTKSWRRSSTGKPASKTRPCICRNSFLYNGVSHSLTRRTAISDDLKDDEERPCLHCLLVESIDNFYAEYPVSEDEPAAIDSDEIVTALAKVVAEMTCSMEEASRQQMIERLMREIMEYDAEFRQQDEMGTAISGARH